VTGTSGSLTETAQILLTVTQGWTVTGFTVTPTSVVGGSPVSGTITLSDPTPAGGEAVSLSVPAASAVYVSFPATVTIPAGQTTLTFSGIQTHTITASHTVVISATLGASSQSASLNGDFIAGGTQAGGLEFFSSPWAYHDLLSKIFEFQIPLGEIAAYDAANFSYVFEGGGIANPTQATITPGIGYWAVFPDGGESLNYLGTPASSTVPTTVALSPGYNAIGDPYTSPVTISSLTFGAGTSFSQATGAATKLISPTLYYFQQDISGTSGSYIATGAGQALTPGKGYWIYAYSATTVTFPLPPVGSAVIAPKH